MLQTKITLDCWEKKRDPRSPPQTHPWGRLFSRELCVHAELLQPGGWLPAFTRVLSGGGAPSDGGGGGLGPAPGRRAQQERAASASATSRLVTKSAPSAWGTWRVCVGPPAPPGMSPVTGGRDQTPSTSEPPLLIGEMGSRASARLAARRREGFRDDQSG